MKILAEPLRGAFLIEARCHEDARGDFVKTYHRSAFFEMGISFTPAESFYSTSRREVIRGMHFQTPPAAHAKVVYCISGRVMDVVLDLRKSSPTYGQAVSHELSRENHRQFFIPIGVAHGFLSLDENSVLVYATDTVHSPSHDAGVRWDSFGFDWETREPLVSPRDAGFPDLTDFVSPF